MYAGELENHITQAEHEIEGYDNFRLPWSKKTTYKSTRERKSREQRKANRKKTLSDIEGKIKENGGIEGISQSLANVFGMFKGGRNAVNTPSNYSVDFGGGNDPEPNKIPTEYKVLGGVALALLAIWGISQLRGSGSNVSTTTQAPAKL